MKIEIEKQINEETKEVWCFTLLGSNCIVFTSWHECSKPKVKRKWVINKYWDKYGHSYHTMVDEPVLPNSIKEDAINEFIKQIKVCIWSEWEAAYT